MSIGKSNSSDYAKGENDAPTGIYGGVNILKVTPPRPETPVMSVARQSITANEHIDSKDNYRDRLESNRQVTVDYIKPSVG